MIAFLVPVAVTAAMGIYLRWASAPVRFSWGIGREFERRRQERDKSVLLHAIADLARDAEPPPLRLVRGEEDDPA